MENENINYIFYLNENKKINPNFFQINFILSKLSIKLIPITIEELINVEKTSRFFLIVIRNTLESGLYFNKAKVEILNSQLLLRKICLFDISSFTPLNLPLHLQNKNLYFNYSIPTSLKEVAIDIADKFYQTKDNESNWPGGKRAKLPPAEIKL